MCIPSRIPDNIAADGLAPNERALPGFDHAEHVPVTRDFLSRLAGIVLENGAIVICCPNGLIPGHEQ